MAKVRGSILCLLFRFFPRVHGPRQKERAIDFLAYRGPTARHPKNLLVGGGGWLEKKAGLALLSSPCLDDEDDHGPWPHQPAKTAEREEEEEEEE